MIKARILPACLVLAALLAVCPTPSQALPPWPGVTFVFDDGFQNVVLAQALFKQYGIVGVSFPIPVYIEVDPEEATWDDLRGLVADGWEIGSHTINHVNLTTVTDTELDYELRMSKQLLEEKLNTSVYTLALPFGGGAYDERVLSAASKYFHFVRNVDWHDNYLPPSPYRLSTFEVYNSTTVAEVIQWIEDARSQGRWPVITFHRIVSGTADPYGDEYSFGTDQLAQILAYVHSHGYPVPTFRGVFAQFPPVANAGANQTVKPGAKVKLNGSLSSDPGAQTPLNFAWSFTSKPVGSSATLSYANTAYPSFTLDVQGSYTVQLVVTNSQGIASQPDTVTIGTSAPSNSPPLADAGLAQTVAQHATVTLDGSGSSDPNGDPITYAWSFISKPAGSTATLSDPTSVNPAFTADKAGDYGLQLVVTDSHAASSTPVRVINSTFNTAPLANAGPSQTVPKNAIVTLDGSGSYDPDGSFLTYTWSFTCKPSGSSASLSNSASPHPTFKPDKIGVFVAQLIVTDLQGAASAPVIVAIKAGPARSGLPAIINLLLND